MKHDTIGIRFAPGTINKLKKKAKAAGNLMVNGKENVSEYIRNLVYSDLKK